MPLQQHDTQLHCFITTTRLVNIGIDGDTVLAILLQYRYCYPYHPYFYTEVMQAILVIIFTAS